MPRVIPSTMAAIEITAPGGPDVLRPSRQPVPVLSAGEILVKVAAAGVNRPDLLQRQGKYPPPPGASLIPGLEIAGEVVDLAPDVTGWKIGDKVVALVAGGGYAEYCAVPAPQALPLPDGFDMIQGAAIPETYFTVWTNLFERGRLAAGDVALIHGGASGIGTTAVQLASAFGAKVFATAGGADKCKAVETLGAFRAIDYKSEDYVAVIKDMTEGRGADVILDMVGGGYVARNIEVAAPDGRIVNIAFLEGAKVEVNLQPIMLKRLTLTGSTLRARPVAAKGAIAKALKEKVWPLFEAGRIKPVIHSVLPLEKAAEAHRELEDGRHIGKIVLGLP
ncbi:NAD(P)H-quinone oxidoreductase [Lacibacterium aquatile]|uniref:NAD(P)H-quinone oxidoreductase n=1 Tax=Lacibacterium aquatile TaxID=1168082 RepID=A0ABW5DS43_9PROT